MPDQDKKFRVLFRGRVAKKFTREQAAASLGKILRQSPESLAPVFSGEQKISFSRKPLDFRSAVKLKAKLLRIGLATDIEPWKTAEPAAASTAKKAKPASDHADATPPPTSSAAPQTEILQQPSATAAGPAADGRESAAEETAKATPPDHDTPAAEEEQPEATAAETPSGNDNRSEPETGQDTADDETDRGPDTVVHIEETPSGRVIHMEASASETVETTAEEIVDEPSTSETVFLEHPDTRPWWKKALSIPVAGTTLLLLTFMVYWIYQLLVFTPSPGTTVIENHLATDDMTMIGLVDLKELGTVSRWLDVDPGALQLPADLAQLERLGIDIENDVHSIIVSQHKRDGRHATTMVLLGDFDKKALRTTLETRFAAKPVDANRNRLQLTLGNGTGCTSDLSIHIARNEIIVTSSDFMDDAYAMIHESFDGKPARLQSWRKFRRHHPISFAVFDSGELTDNMARFVTAPLGSIERQSISELYIGLDVAHILTGSARIAARIGFNSHDALAATEKAIRATSPLASAAEIRIANDHLEFSAPLTAKSPILGPLKTLSLLGLCSA